MKVGRSYITTNYTFAVYKTLDSVIKVRMADIVGTVAPGSCFLVVEQYLDNAYSQSQAKHFKILASGMLGWIWLPAWIDSLLETQKIVQKGNWSIKEIV